MYAALRFESEKARWVDPMLMYTRERFSEGIVHATEIARVIRVNTIVRPFNYDEPEAVGIAVVRSDRSGPRSVLGALNFMQREDERIQFGLRYDISERAVLTSLLKNLVDRPLAVPLEKLVADVDDFSQVILNRKLLPQEYFHSDDAAKASVLVERLCKLLGSLREEDLACPHAATPTPPTEERRQHATVHRRVSAPQYSLHDIYR
jgi:hypothetical protein